MASGVGAAGSGDGARSRILETAYELFSHHGVRAVGIDRIIAEASIAKATLYRHFASKEELVLAFLELRERRWTREWLEAETERNAPEPRNRALYTYELLDEWFHEHDFAGCPFINTLLEIREAESAIHRAAVHHLDVIRQTLERYAEQAGVRDPRETGHRLQMLMMGAIVSARRGDLEAARHARSSAALLLRDSS
jgi:AcrR family transcriptional regulator